MAYGNKTEATAPSNDICRISKGTSINGIVTSTSDIRIDGSFEGTLYTKGKLVVGDLSTIKGKIFCNSCDLWGCVDGEIYVEDIINLKSNSSFSGALKAPKVGIEVGAIFNGQCNIITKEAYTKYLNDTVTLPKESAVNPKGKEDKK